MSSPLQKICLLTLAFLLMIPAMTDSLGAQEEATDTAAVQETAANNYGKDPAPTIKRTPWSQEILDEVARWPIQHGGRVKPFQTFAGFLMLKANGRRFLTVEDEKLDPVAWALDFMFYPEVARQYRCIHVPNAEVQIGRAHV